MTRDGDRDYHAVVSHMPFPTTGCHTVTVAIRETSGDDSMGIGVVRSFDHILQHHRRADKAWIGSGEFGWVLFQDGDSGHDGEWKGNTGGAPDPVGTIPDPDYTKFRYGVGDEVTVQVDAEKQSISWIVQPGGRGSKTPALTKREVYSGVGTELHFAVAERLQMSVEVLRSSFDLNLPDAGSPMHGRDVSVADFYTAKQSSKVDGRGIRHGRAVEPLLASFYKFNGEVSGIRGPSLVLDHNDCATLQVLQEVELHVLRAESADSCFKQALTAVKSLLSRCAQESPALRGNDFAAELGPWKSAGAVLLAFGFEKVDTILPPDEAVVENLVKCGDTVVLKDLKGVTAEFNGELGVVEEYVEEKGRYAVKGIKKNSMKNHRMFILAENLELVVAPSVEWTVSVGKLSDGSGADSRGPGGLNLGMVRRSLL